MIDGDDVPALVALREGPEHGRPARGVVLDQEHAVLHGRLLRGRNRTEASASRCVGDAASNEWKTQEFRKERGAGQMRAPRLSPAAMSRPGKDEYHRKPKRGLFDDPGQDTTGRILYPAADSG